MTLLVHVSLLAFAIGFVTGLRSMTPIAVVAWCAHLGRPDLAATRLSFLSSTIAVTIFTLAALAELVADKQPKTPARTAPPSFVVRFVFGALCGAALALASAQVGWLAGRGRWFMRGICWLSGAHRPGQGLWRPRFSRCSQRRRPRHRLGDPSRHARLTLAISRPSQKANASRPDPGVRHVRLILYS